MGGAMFKNILNFAVRTIFIQTLAEEYLGVNALMQSVITMLSLTELGISAAIGFNLYKPLAENNIPMIKSLMKFYKNVYRIVAVTIMGLGLILVPFIQVFANDIKVIGKTELRLIFLLYLIDTASSYLMSYKTTLVDADQKKYRLVIIWTVFECLLILSQGTMLLLTQNFYAYIAIRLGMNLANRLFTNNFINKKYPYLRDKSIDPLPSQMRSSIVTNIKAMFLHHISDWAIESTDVMIISWLISITVSARYSNYQLITSMLDVYILMIFFSATASFGNLIASEPPARRLEVFKAFNFFGFWIFGIVSVCIYTLSENMLGVWLSMAGQDPGKWLLGQELVIVIAVAYYLRCMISPVNMIKKVSGIYNPDKYVAVVQAIINLVASIVLALYMGIVGVLIGTIICYVSIPIWNRPRLIYKYVFERSPARYYVKYLIFFSITAANAFVAGLLCDLIFPKDNYTLLNLFGRAVISFILPNIVVLLLFHRTKEFKELIRLIKQIFPALREKIRAKKA